MGGLVALDVVAGLFLALGFMLTFKPDTLRALWFRGRGGQSQGVSEDVASALRIAGVMVMAFSVTICVFANLIAHYSKVSSEAGNYLSR